MRGGKPFTYPHIFYLLQTFWGCAEGCVGAPLSLSSAQNGMDKRSRSRKRKKKKKIKENRKNEKKTKKKKKKGLRAQGSCTVHRT